MGRCAEATVLLVPVPTINALKSLGQEPSYAKRILALSFWLAHMQHRQGFGCSLQHACQDAKSVRRIGAMAGVRMTLNKAVRVTLAAVDCQRDRATYRKMEDLLASNTRGRATAHQPWQLQHLALDAEPCGMLVWPFDP